MNGLEVQNEMKSNGNVHTRVFRVILTSHLEKLQPLLRDTISRAFSHEIDSAIRVEENWRKLHGFSMAKRLITNVNSLVFFGDKLSQEPEFLLAAEQYLDDLFITAEIIRLVSAFLGPLVAPILMHQHKASKTMVRFLTPVVEQRIRQSGNRGVAEQKHIDCIQFFVDATSRKKEWNATKIIQVLLGIWFASVHQPAMCLVYALDDLCDHSEHIDLLREEFKHSAQNGGGNLPLLDSFLKESARLHPSDAISVRRLVLRPYTFSDGTHVSAGDVACIPLQAILIDEKHYPNSMAFDAFRFLDQTSKANSTPFTNASAQFPLWGLGRHAW